MATSCDTVSNIRNRSWLDTLTLIHKHTVTTKRTLVLHEISGLLNTGLDKNSLSILVQLCEMGVNPGALIHVVQELRREGASRVQVNVGASVVATATTTTTATAHTTGISPCLIRRSTCLSLTHACNRPRYATCIISSTTSGERSSRSDPGLVFEPVLQSIDLIACLSQFPGSRITIFGSSHGFISSMLHVRVFDSQQ